MDVSSVDNILMNSFGMNEMGNIDSEKYSKGIFSPSAKIDDALPVTQTQKVTSPQKSISPHVVPHFQHPLAPPQGAHQLPRMSPIPQTNFQQPHHHHMQRKVQLGPNFDRLGILNQANEIPPMSAPYFAKALQQHGGSTLGAILQAHQHALQQQMQRESFLLQQAVHQQMFQNVPFNLYQQQRMNTMMLDRRTDDQIVPNGQMIPPPENWLKQSTRPSPSKRIKLKHDDVDITDRRTVNCYKHMPESNDKYVIFNDENHLNQTSEDEDSSPPIAPPKDSVFVRYPTDNYKTLPSFSETFSGHIEKLKLKEQHLKDSLLLRHGVSEHMAPVVYNTQRLISENPLNPINPINQQMLPDGMTGNQVLTKPCSQHEILSQTKLTHHVEPDTDIGETLIPISGIVKRLMPENNIPHTMLSRTEDVKSDPDDTNSQNSTQYEASVDTLLKSSEGKIEDESSDAASVDKHENKDTESDSNQVDTTKQQQQQKQQPLEDNRLDYLNLNSIGAGDNDILSQNDTEKSPSRKTEKNRNTIEKSNKNENESYPEGDDGETENATNNLTIFQADLGLDTDNPNYDNLFNGNSDEHYFQAFKENNLHLIADLNENKVDNGDDILKLLHSPLDFLNDKFLR